MNAILFSYLPITVLINGFYFQRMHTAIKVFIYYDIIFLQSLQSVSFERSIGKSSNVEVLDWVCRSHGRNIVFIPRSIDFKDYFTPRGAIPRLLVMNQFEL